MSPKCKFVGIINYYLQAFCPDMKFSNNEYVAHTANKDIHKTTLRFLEKVTMHSTAASIVPPTAGDADTDDEGINTSAPNASHCKSPRKAMSQKKRSTETVTPSMPSKKQIRFALELTDEEIVEKAARLTAELERVKALQAEVVAAKQKKAIAATEKPKKKPAAPSPYKPSPPKFKRFRKGLPSKPSKPASTSTYSNTNLFDIPTTTMIMSPKEASAIIPQEYKSTLS